MDRRLQVARRLVAIARHPSGRPRNQALRFQCQYFQKFQKRGVEGWRLAFLKRWVTLHYDPVNGGIFCRSVDFDRRDCVICSFFGHLGDVLWTTDLQFNVAQPTFFSGLTQPGMRSGCDRCYRPPPCISAPRFDIDLGRFDQRIASLVSSLSRSRRRSHPCTA